MNTDDRAMIKNAFRLMFMLVHTKMEIATLVAKNQNAPKYLYTQAQELQEQIEITLQDL